jgi:hypothetical protein
MVKNWLEVHWVRLTVNNEALIALQPLIAVFEHLGVSYRVGGSLASSVHGLARATMDADLIANIELQHVPALVRALHGAYYADAELISDALKSGQSFNLIHLETYIKIDIFPLVSRSYDQISFKRVFIAEETNFITAEDSILRKLEWYRLSDGSERQWRDVAGVLQMQKDQLDFEYLQRWAAEMNLSDLLERAIQESLKDQS